MKFTEEDVAIKIYVDEKEKLNGVPIYETIVLKARELGIAGATVYKGIFGFGHSQHIHTNKLIEFSNNLPIIIEIIDTELKIKSIESYIDSIIIHGMVTKEKISITRYCNK